MDFITCFTTVIIVVNFVTIPGFLLDGSQRQNITSVMSDKHFNMLMTLLQDERQSRVQLERYVLSLDNTVRNMNVKFDSDLRNLNTSLSSPCSLENQNETVDDINYLRLKYMKLSEQNRFLNKTNSQLENKIMALEQNIESLNHLDSVSDLQTLMALLNKTDQLETENRLFNHRLNSLSSDATARKQDFIALYQNVQGLDQQIRTINDRGKV